MKDVVKAIEAANATVWRDWLEANCQTEKSVWLIIYKKSSKRSSVYYDEAVDEALCFGWIDSKPNKRDAESYYQFFSKRNPKSNWSAVNKSKVERLIKANKMATPGLEMIRIAKQSGTWSALDDVENLIVPDDLRAELKTYSNAEKYFEEFPKSVKRGILEWIFSAKRPETRIKRIKVTARLANENIRANQYSQPKGQR